MIPLESQYAALNAILIKGQTVKEICQEFKISKVKLQKWLMNKDSIIRKYESKLIISTKDPNHFVRLSTLLTKYETNTNDTNQIQRRKYKNDKHISVETKYRTLFDLYSMQKSKKQIYNELNISEAALFRWIEEKEAIFKSFESTPSAKEIYKHFTVLLNKQKTRMEIIQELKIHESTLNRWIMEEESFREFPLIQNALINWYYENKEQYRLNDVPISVNDLRRKAEDFAILYKYINFRGTKAWIETFVRRYNIEGIVFQESSTIEGMDNSEANNTEESCDDDQETTDDVIVIEEPKALNMHQAIPDDVRKAYTTLRLFFQSRPFDTSQHLKALQEMSHDPRIKF